VDDFSNPGSSMTKLRYKGRLRIKSK